MNNKTPGNPQVRVLPTRTIEHGRRISIPEHCHPLVALLYTEIRDGNFTLAGVAQCAGVPLDTLMGWRKKHNPDLINLEACFNALGYELTITKREAAE